MFHKVTRLLLFVTVLVSVIKTSTGCSKDTLVYMLIASCGESKRSDFYDYPVVSKKEFDSLLEKLKESEDTLPGGHALDSFFLSSQEMDKHADPTENYKHRTYATEKQGSERLPRRFSPRIMYPLLAKQGNPNEDEDVSFDNNKENNSLYIRSKRTVFPPSGGGGHRFDNLMNKCCHHICTARDFREFCF